MLLGCVAAVGWWYWQAAFQSDVLQLHIPEQSDHDSCAGQKVIGFPQESVIGFVQESVIGFGQEPVIGITQE